jgi:hypothetical protein
MYPELQYHPSPAKSDGIFGQAAADASSPKSIYTEEIDMSPAANKNDKY